MRFRSPAPYQAANLCFEEELSTSTKDSSALTRIPEQRCEFLVGLGDSLNDLF